MYLHQQSLIIYDKLKKKNINTQERKHTPEAALAALRDSLQIQFVDDVLVNALVLEKHQHIDRKIRDGTFHGKVVIAEDHLAFYFIIRNFQDIVHSAVTLVVFAGFDFNRKNLFLVCHDKIKLTLFLVVEVSQRESVGCQFLSRGIFEYSSIVDIHLTAKKFQLQSI